MDSSYRGRGESLARHAGCNEHSILASDSHVLVNWLLFWQSSHQESDDQRQIWQDQPVFSSEWQHAESSKGQPGEGQDFSCKAHTRRCAGLVPHYLQCTSECQYRRGHDKVQRKTSFSPVYASQAHKVWYQSLDAIWPDKWLNKWISDLHRQSRGKKRGWPCWTSCLWFVPANLE